MRNPHDLKKDDAAFDLSSNAALDLGTLNPSQPRDAYMVVLPDEKHKRLICADSASERDAAKPRSQAPEGDAGGMQSPNVIPIKSRHEKLFDEMWGEWAARAREDAKALFDWRCSCAGSDLERQFLAALMFLRSDYVGAGYGGPLCAGRADLIVRSQESCGPYTIDFAVIVPAEVGFQKEEIKIAIECDGFYWHDRTKEQAERDKKRDRYLTIHGWRPMRFAESEIRRDPRACVAQVSELVGELLQGQFDRSSGA